MHVIPDEVKIKIKDKGSLHWKFGSFK
jgi:hypothetical protein